MKLLLLVVIAAVGAAPEARIAGVVRDERSGAVLRDVEISVDGERSVLTDGHGRFELRHVPPGRHLLHVHALGFDALSTDENVDEGRTTKVVYVLRRSRGARRVSHLVDEETLAMTAPVSSNEVLRTLPGVHVVDEEGMGLRPNIGIRGLAPYRSRKVLVLEDGVPIAAAPYSDPDLVWAPAIERIARIDVVTSAESVLMGPNTLGGVIDYRTPDPPRSMRVTNEARLGSAGYWMGHLSVGNTHGPVGYRVDVVHRHFNGPRVLQLQLLDVTGKVRVELGPRSSATFKLGLYSEESNATERGLTSSQWTDNRWSERARDNRFILRRAGFQASHDVKAADWLRFHTDAYVSQLQLRTTAPRESELTVIGVEPRTLVGGFTLGPTRHEVTVGTRVHVERVDERNAVAWVVFGQYLLTVMESVRIIPALRLENIFRRREGPTMVLIPGISASYQVLRNLAFFAGIHRGYAPSRTTRPELSWNLEAGSRFSIAEWLHADLTAFHLDVENRALMSNRGALVGGGRSRHTGIEAAATFDIASMTGWGFRVPYTLSYTYTEARFLSGPFKGHRLPYAPQHLLSSRVMLVHPWGFDAAITGTYVSPQFADNENTKADSLDGEEGVLGHRLVVDARVAYTFLPLGLGVFVSGKNIADAHYIASRSSGIHPGVPRQMMVGFRGEL